MQVPAGDLLLFGNRQIPLVFFPVLVKGCRVEPCLGPTIMGFLLIQNFLPYRQSLSGSWKPYKNLEEISYSRINVSIKKSEKKQKF